MIQNISIVIPYYNEENCISTIVNDILSLNDNLIKYVKDFLFLDDASKDNTTKKIKKLLKSKKEIFKKCKFIKNDKNRGFAESVRKGFSLASGDIVLEIPGDGEALLSEILPKMIRKSNKFDVIFFERKNIYSRPLTRIIISYLFRIIVTLIFNTKFKDTNGVLAIKKKNLYKLDVASNSFFLNAEILAKSIFLKHHISFDYFSLNSRKNYKSTSLNFLQFLLLLKDVFKTISFIYGTKKI